MGKNLDLEKHDFILEYSFDKNSGGFVVHTRGALDGAALGRIMPALLAKVEQSLVEKIEGRFFLKYTNHPKGEDR